LRRIFTAKKCAYSSARDLQNFHQQNERGQKIMGRRNPQDQVALLKDEIAEKDEYIEDLEDKVDRLAGRLSRVQAIADVDDIIDGDDSDEDSDDDSDGEDSEGEDSEGE
jgi:predicted  nucleic acid-binding Zn-ribbon protein